MMKFTRKGRWLAAILAVAITIPLASCSSEENSAPSYDPSKPIVCESFSPTGGPISTQVILTGQNFGSDVSAVKVFFNEKEAPVIGVNDDHMLVLAPRLPGENVVIKVVIGDQEACFGEYFDYQIQTNISTICGGDASATTDPVGTVSLAEAQFKHSISDCIQCDRRGNIFFGFNGDNSDHIRYVANTTADKLKVIDNPGVFLTVPIVVYHPVKDRVYHMQANIANSEYWWYDQDNDFVQMDKSSVSWDDMDFVPSGMAAWAARRTAAYNWSDGMFYTRGYGGYLIRFDPETAMGQNLTYVYASAPGIGTTNGSTYGSVFDKETPNIMYFSNDDTHCIYRLDVSSGSCTVLTGTSGTSGYMDGPLKQAQFNSPHQMCIDSENNIYVTDTNNHCIRKINLKTGFVSTVAGIPQSSGYVNGTSESAKFNKPVGLCIDQNDILFVGDSENHAIRRVAIE